MARNKYQSYTPVASDWYCGTLCLSLTEERERWVPSGRSIWECVRYVDQAHDIGSRRGSGGKHVGDAAANIRTPNCNYQLKRSPGPKAIRHMDSDVTQSRPPKLLPVRYQNGSIGSMV